MAGLPFILEILKQKELNAYFVYSNDKLFKEIPDYYRKIIYNNFQIIRLKKKNFINFFSRFIFSKSYIFSCDGGHGLYAKICSMYWYRSRSCFFAHGYALLGEKVDQIVLDNFAYYKSLLSGHHHYEIILAHNSTEIIERKNFGFIPENIVIAGNIGYKQEWLEILNEASEDIIHIQSLRKRFQKTVLITTRDVHELYLSQENSDYLFHGIKEMVETYSQYLFLIKLHPRQQNTEQFYALKNRFINIEIVNLSTMTLGKLTDLTISYWSGSVGDVIASGCPVIEFFRYEVYHSQLIKTKKGLVSLYHKYNLCPFYNNKEDVLELLADPNRWEDIKKVQKKYFDKIFLEDYPQFVDELFNRFEKTPFKYSYLWHLFLFPFQLIFIYFKNSIKQFFG